MNQQQQDDLIKQLQESNQELKRQIELQAKQIEALKTAPAAQSDEERFAPYQGGGWAIVKATGLTYHEILSVEKPGKRHDYYAYPTQEQAEWEHKATQVRRKLQRICAVLGPFKDGYYRTFTAMEVTTCIKFARLEDARKAEQILGDDLKYLNWYNSPEAQDAREGQE